MSGSNKRLALFLPGLYDGGAERVILNLADGISRRGYSVDLLLARAEGPFLAEVPERVRTIDLRVARVLNSTWAVARYLRSEKPAAMLSALHANIPAVWAKLLSGYRGRLVISEHNTLSRLAHECHDLRWRVFPQLAHWFYPLADEIVAVSAGVGEDLAAEARIACERIQVVYNPIVTPDLFEKSTEPLKDPWFGAGKPPVVLAVGRLTAQKSLDTLVRAFAQVRKQRAARLLILGEGEDRADLERLVSELGLEDDVRLPGFVSNPYCYMAQATVFVLSSRWEGLPTVLVEAMSLGAPLVATDCPSGPREILQGGKYGRLVPVRDSDALARAILAAVDGDVPRPPVESWRPFEIEHVIDQYVDILLGGLQCAK